MKYFAIFAAVLGVAMALPTSSVWTLQQLSDAIEDRHTDQALIPYLEQALDKLMASLMAGNNVNAIVVHVPAEIAAIKPVPVIPEVVPAPSAKSGPLVQLIINVNQVKSEVAESPVAPEIVAPEIVPTPVEVAESPEHEDVVVGPVIVGQPIIINPVDVINPVPSPVADGDFGVIV